MDEFLNETFAGQFELDMATIEDVVTSTLSTYNVSYESNDSSNDTTAIGGNKTGSHEMSINLYMYFIPPMLVLCTLSLIINFRVLIAAYWIRRPMSPTLHISLSLAGADALASTLVLTALTVNSYLANLSPPIHLPECIKLTIELGKYCALYTTLAHLVALSVNHYIGILKPLHIHSIMTHRKTTILIAAMWIVPLIVFFIYAISIPGDGYRSESCKSSKLLKSVTFRVVFSLICFSALLLMIVCYVHILVIVRHQQAMWDLRLSRLGSTRNRGGYRNSRHGGQHNQHQQMLRNVKAITTTLHILGSCILGWLPAILMFVLICDGCIISKEKFKDTFSSTQIYFLYWFSNLLIIVKMFLNPIIYSARMPEIKESSIKMGEAIKHLVCGSRRTNDPLYESQAFFASFGSYRNSKPSLLHRTGNNGTSHVVHQRAQSQNGSGGGGGGTAGGAVIPMGTYVTCNDNCQIASTDAVTII